jgi:hypothetical protein
MAKTKAKKKRGGAKAKSTTAKKAAPKKPVKKKTVSKKAVKKTAARSRKPPAASSGLLGRFASGVGRALQGAVEGAVAAVAPQSTGNPEEGSSPPASTQKK